MYAVLARRQGQGEKEERTAAEIEPVKDGEQVVIIDKDGIRLRFGYEILSLNLTSTRPSLP